MEPKVLIGCPTYFKYKYCIDKFLEAIKQLNYSNYKLIFAENSENNNYFNYLKSLGCEVIKIPFTNTPLQRIVDSRNTLIEYALQNNYDYFFSVDQDVILPQNSIPELINMNKDISVGIYFNIFNVDNKAKLRPLIYNGISEKEFEELREKYPLPPSIKNCHDLKRFVTLDEIKNNKILKIRQAGAGCMLISKKVLEANIKFGILEIPNSKHITTDDIYFCEMANAKGFEIYANTEIICDHLIKEKYILKENVLLNNVLN